MLTLVEIISDNSAPLRENVVIQFQTTNPHTLSLLKQWEGEFKGRFQGGAWVSR